MESNDFLSHDFSDEFTMDVTEPDDSLVQVRRSTLKLIKDLSFCLLPKFLNLFIN